VASTDRRLLRYVKRQIRQGDTHIRVPSSLLERASEKARRDVRELCKANNVDLAVEAEDST
jgi:hypothetical protein